MQKGKATEETGKEQVWASTEAAARVVIERSTTIGARVGSTAEVCVRQGSRSIVPPPFCRTALNQPTSSKKQQKRRIYHYNAVNFKQNKFFLCGLE